MATFEDVLDRSKAIRVPDTKLDSEWLRTTLSVSLEKYNKVDVGSLFYSNVLYETMDTSLGGHICLNPPYGFTPGADSYYKGKLKGRFVDTPELDNINIGMGRIYKENIQDNSHVRTLALTMGVPNFQGIVGYLIGAVDFAKLIIGQEGRSPSAYYAGQAIGIYISFMAFPIFTASYYIISKVWKLAFGASDPRYYSMKHDMDNYWTSLNNLMQLSASERGFTKLELFSSATGKRGAKVGIQKEDKDLMAEMMPNVFNSNGVIDVLKIASRYQKILNKRLENTARAYDTGNLGLMDTEYDPEEGIGKEELNDTILTMESFIAKEKKAKDTTPSSDVPKLTEQTNDLTPREQTDTSSWVKDVLTYMSAGSTKISDALFLQVEYLPPSGDNFTNSSKDMPLKNMLDTGAGAFRDIRFSMAGSATPIGEAVTEVIKKARDVVWGVLDGRTFGISNIIHSILGGGFLDLPKMWDNSTSAVASHEFKITLNSPYGNTASLIMDLDIVLYALLNASLPRAVGRSSYTSPYLIKAFIAGSVNIDFGVISSISVTRGVGNIKQNHKGAPLAIEVTFTVEDYSNIFSTPINDGLLGAYTMATDEYQMINKYVKMIAGTSVSDSLYMKRKALKRISATYGGIATNFNINNLAFLSGLSAGSTPVLSNIRNVLHAEQSGVYMFNEP